MSNDTIEMTGGEALARTIRGMNPGPIFGMGGFQLLPFYEAIRQLGMKHILINDERCGIFAADAYSKVTGRVGLCDATLGPGATNLATGLAEAYNAGSPIIAIVGDSHRAHSWKNMTQEAPQSEVLRPLCKEFIRVEMIERIPEAVQRAFTVATSGRPGPVVVAVPEDIAHALATFDLGQFEAPAIFQSSPALRCRPAAADVARAVQLLREAKRPLMLCGGGVHLSGAAQTVQDFAEAFGIPVAHTLTGKGAISCASPLNAGLFGRYDRIANGLIETSDLLFVVGCKLGEIATKRFALPLAERRIIHLELLPEEFDRTTRVDLRLWGDVKETLLELNSHLAPEATTLSAARESFVSEVAERMNGWRVSVGARLTSEEKPIAMSRLLTEIGAALPADGILVADGGFAAHWAGLLYDTKQPGRSFVPDRGFASIGYGIPGAIGAALAAPDRIVVSLTGDGGCNMSLGELETARRLGLAFTLVVVNNAASGYIKALQHLMYGEGKYQSSDLAETNYARIADAMGCRGIRVEDPSEISGALRAAFAEKSVPTLIDVVVTRDPAKMLPGVDSRTQAIKKGDRIA